MKKSDLHREWARVLDMCEGTSVNPFFCWKYNGENRWFNPIHNGEFDGDPNKHEFMVEILEDKPVFIGDKVWSDLLNREYTISNCTHNFNGLTWKPPKKTFMLNGDELPCPDGNKGGYQISLLSGRHYFSNFHDAQKVANAFDKLLSDNTK